MKGSLLLLMISVFCALLFHWRIKHYLFAVFGAASMASVLFQIAAYFQLGYLDPFFAVALLTGGLFAMVVAFIAGVPFYVARDKSKRRDPE